MQIGRKIADSILNHLKSVILKKNINPVLAILCGTNDSATLTYVHMKEKVAYRIGIRTKVIDIHKMSIVRLRNVILNLDNDYHIDSIILERPLPYYLRKYQSYLNNLINMSKDVDGSNTINLGSSLINKYAVIPCTALAINKLLTSVVDSLIGLRVAIINRSVIVGKPLAALLINEDAEVTVFNHFMNYSDLAHYDVIVAATGKPNLITANDVTSQQILIPVSEVQTKQGLQGDFTQQALDKAHIGFSCTGNVGPLTNAYLMEHVVQCFKGA